MHTDTPALVVSGGLRVQSPHTDWPVLRARPSPSQAPGPEMDIIPWGQGGQQVSLLDWPRVSAALSQLVSWPSPFSPHWRPTRVPDGHRSFAVGTFWLQETTGNPGGQECYASAGILWPQGTHGHIRVQSPGLAGEWWATSSPLHPHPHC